MQWRKLTKEERVQNFINKSSILNVTRVAKRFTDITTTTTTTTTTHNNNYYYNKNNNKKNTNENTNDKKNNTAYLLRKTKTILVVYTVENIYYNKVQ